jgi:hypothetical protein
MTGQAHEVTKQVEIRANADVRIAEINANAVVDVAQMTKAIFLIITLTFLSTVAGCGVIVGRIAGYGQERETTKQVQIRANADVRIAEINANAVVDVAQINADAQRDTSMAYLAHRAFTAVLWALVVVWGAVALWAVNRWGMVKR